MAEKSFGYCRVGREAVLIVGLLCSPAAKAQPQALCQAKESVLFACTANVKRDQVPIALCGPQELKKSTGWLQFRARVKDDPILNYPEGNRPNLSEFKLTNEGLEYGGKPLSYTVVPANSALSGRMPQGGAVLLGGGLPVAFRCIDDPIDRLSSLKDYLE